MVDVLTSSRRVSCSVNPETTAPSSPIIHPPATPQTPATSHRTYPGVSTQRLTIGLQLSGALHSRPSQHSSFTSAGFKHCMVKRSSHTSPAAQEALPLPGGETQGSPARRGSVKQRCLVWGRVEVVNEGIFCRMMM